MDGGSQLYKKLLKSWLRDSYIQIYSIVNERKSVIAERFIRTSKKKKKKKKIKCVSTISKTVYIDTLGDIFDKKTVHIREQSKWSLLVLKHVHALIFMLKIIIKILNLKSMIMWQYQNTEHFYKTLQYKLIRRSFS